MSPSTDPLHCLMMAAGYHPRYILLYQAIKEHFATHDHLDEPDIEEMALEVGCLPAEIIASLKYLVQYGFLHCRHYALHGTSRIAISVKDLSTLLYEAILSRNPDAETALGDVFASWAPAPERPAALH